ncbi:MAG: hypothetical protein ACK41D_00685 [Rubricoccaceae bacterium]
MLFPDLPDHARVWLFAARDGLSPKASTALLDGLALFLSAWTSHGRPVEAAAAVQAGRVLVVAANIDAAEHNAGVSGCGIDKMEHAVAQAAVTAGIAWTGPLDVLFRDAGGAWQAVPRPAFRALAQAGTVTAATPLLDLTPTTLGAIRQHGLVRPAGDTWAARAFGLGAEADAR